MLDLLPVVLVLVAAVAYGTAVPGVWHRYGRRSLPPYRVTCFGLGLLTAAACLSGPMDRLAEARFSAHMVQHVLLMLVAAPLLVLGTPLTVLVLSLSVRGRRQITTPALRSRGGRWMLSPRVGWTSFVVVLCGSHLPAVYDAAVAHEGLHAVEHATYLLTAMLFWSAVAGLELGPPRASYPARLLFLFLSMAAMAVLGEALATADRPLYPYYVATDRAAGVSALADQHSGAVIMWLGGTFTVVPAMALVVLAWMAEDERQTRRQEARQARPGPEAVPRL